MGFPGHPHVLGNDQKHLPPRKASRLLTVLFKEGVYLWLYYHNLPAKHLVEQRLCISPRIRSLSAVLGVPFSPWSELWKSQAKSWQQILHAPTP
jgi:hypothetical protein